MAKSALKLEIDGLKELQAKAVQMAAAMHGQEIANAMRDSVIAMHQRAALGPPGGRKGAGTTPVGYIPRDTSRLLSSLTPQITSSANELRGVVGTNVKYGPYQEFGTKRGVRALKYMKTALAQTREYIQGRFDRAMAAIVKKRPK